MDKSITYYFDNLERLDEVSEGEIRIWIDDMPYSQPLYKLLELKMRRTGSSTSDELHQNAAYHATDIDADIRPKQIKNQETISKKVEPKPVAVEKVVYHNLASVEKEEHITEELLEVDIAEDDTDILGKAQKKTLKKGKKKKEEKTIYHELASVKEEEEVDVELMEVSTNYKLMDGGVEMTELMPTEDVKPKDTLVNYIDKDIDLDIVVNVEDTDLDVSKYEIENTEKLIEVENLSLSKPNKKPKKKAKTTKSKHKVKAQTKKHIRTVSKSSKNKSKPEARQKVEPKKVPQKEKSIIYLKKKQKPDFDLHEYKGESDYIKWLITTKSENQEQIVEATKKKKKSKEKVSKKVESKNKDAKKSVKSKSSKDKKSKKTQKSIKKLVLRAAAESVKKRDMIISETLADILAAQGHTKKAKKMYKQLCLIFPEKSSFFAAKIKKLKKK